MAHRLEVPKHIAQQQKAAAAIGAQAAEYTAMFSAGILSQWAEQDASNDSIRAAISLARRSAWILMEEVGIIGDAESFIEAEQRAKEDQQEEESSDILTP